MPKFKYQAIDLKGKQKAGFVNASNADEANAKVGMMGLAPLDVFQVRQSVSGETKQGNATIKNRVIGFSFGRAVKPEALTVFTRQMAILLRANLPLLKALEVMIRQERNLRFKDSLGQIADQVRSGNKFSDGLLQHPGIFNRLYINMVCAGEAAGILDVILSRIADFMEKTQSTKRKVKSAMTYPIIVITVAVLIVSLLMVVVVPKFQSIFDDMLNGAPLPGPTRLVIDTSRFLGDNIIVSILIAVGAIFGIKFLQRTKSGLKASSWLAIHFPKIGSLVRKVNVARITRTFGTLLSSGVPILQALTITKDITDNVFYANALVRIHDHVRDGESLSSQMGKENVFPDVVSSMVDVGEETGELAEMLNLIADNYDEDVDVALDSITSVIEPLMIVFLAIVVGFIVVALFMPIVEIINQLTGG